VGVAGRNDSKAGPVVKGLNTKLKEQSSVPLFADQHEAIGGKDVRLLRV
jgi:hypothetical protein